jgi:hypothetical protein
MQTGSNMRESSSIRHKVEVLVFRIHVELKKVEVLVLRIHVELKYLGIRNFNLDLVKVRPCGTVVQRFVVTRGMCSQKCNGAEMRIEEV